MLHTCAVRFDVTRNLKNFLDFEVNLNKARRAKHAMQRPFTCMAPRHSGTLGKNFKISLNLYTHK